MPRAPLVPQSCAQCTAMPAASPPYPLVVFDLDGTLVDSFPWFLRVMNVVAREYKFKEVAPGEVDTLRRAGWRDLLRRLDVPLWKLPMIMARLRALKREHIAGIPLFPGAADMLRTLADSGIRIGLVSSDDEDNALRQLGDNAALFSFVDCGAPLFGKAEKFKRMVAHAGIVPREAIAIGDEVRDARAARSAGLAFGAVTWGYAHPDTLHAQSPDALFTRMEEIAARLA
jgi:phosphoglycolate phosphatase